MDHTAADFYYLTYLIIKFAQGKIVLVLYQALIVQAVMIVRSYVNRVYNRLSLGYVKLMLVRLQSYRQYENTPIQIYRKFHPQKTERFSDEKLWYFSYFC